jgi:vacuolar-type H+-ATPase subunit H
MLSPLCDFLMKEENLIHVINKIEKPSEEVINQFREIGSATVHEASGRKGAVITERLRGSQS